MTPMAGLFIWLGLAALAVLWPDRLLSPFDGVPLDGRLEAVVIGLLLPMLGWFYPRYVRTPWARRLIVTLLVWKVVAWLTFTQQAWCGKFETETPHQVAAATTQRSWDLRTDWRQPLPTCSAILARPSPTLASLPVWFINLFGEYGRPPEGTFTLEIDGYLSTRERGTLSLSGAEALRLKGSIGSRSIGVPGTGSWEIPVEVGVHAVHVEARLPLSGAVWRFVPLWAGKDLWSSVATTVDVPSFADRRLWKVGRLITPTLVVMLILGWGVSAFAARRPNLVVLGWATFASLAMAGLAFEKSYERFAVLLLFGCLAVPICTRFANLRGGFLLLGVPWLSFFGTKHFSQIGHVTFYSLGDDWITFQRFAHRIFMEGYWLEGGEKTFWHQPLYRWIAGTLHLVFGDSSVGEAYWDAFCLLIAALFCFHLVKTFAGFRWGLFAGAMTLATFAVGPIWWLIGRGLSEISATGWAYLAALSLLRGRLGRWRSWVAAAALATLAFYTRLNYLPFAVSLAALCLPLRLPAGNWLPLRRFLRRLTPAMLAVYLGVFACGVGLFALRTWYYTGTFSVLLGTQRDTVATGLRLRTLHRPRAWRRAATSVWTVATVDAPPLNLRAIFVSAGAVIAALAVLRVPLLRKLPMAACFVCMGALVASLQVRSGAYPGRHSVHVVPVATAVSICAMALGLRKLTAIGAIRRQDHP